MPSISSDKQSVNSGIASRVLLRPRMTEKAHAALGMGKYVFQVTPRSTKASVKRAVEEVYGVTVTGVTMTRIPRKRRVFGRTVGWKSAVKKATVTLKSGESIELFKGV